MATYNHTKTAYKRFDSSRWFLVPDGKKRAPLFTNGPELDGGYREFVSDEEINLITNRDRIILLEAVAGGCYDRTWRTMKKILRDRSQRNYHTLVRATGLDKE